MNNIINQILSISLWAGVTLIGYSQSTEITVKFIGNCGLYLTDGTIHLYTDFPYKSGAHGYMEFAESELDSIQENALFLFTHKHSDHYSRKSLKKIRKEKNGKAFGPWNSKDLATLSESIPNFTIQPFKTKHAFSLNHHSYLITWHGKRIFISGDTEHAETIGSLNTIDWAIVPYWILLDANEKGIDLDAEKFLIYHLASVQAPSAKEKWGDDPKFHPLIDQGEMIKI